MRMPNLAAPVSRSVATHSVSAGIEQSGCSIFKKAACVAAGIACGAVCIGTFGSPACLACISSTVGGCGDCF